MFQGATRFLPLEHTLSLTLYLREPAVNEQENHGAKREGARAHALAIKQAGVITHKREKLLQGGIASLHRVWLSPRRQALFFHIFQG